MKPYAFRGSRRQASTIVRANGEAELSLPPQTAHWGHLRLLDESLTALFCSNRCPGDLILKTYDLARAMRSAGVPVVGGFQTSMEKECLRLLLRGSQPVVICPARGIDNMRIPRDWRIALDGGRLLVLSPIPQDPPPPNGHSSGPAQRFGGRTCRANTHHPRRSRRQHRSLRPHTGGRGKAAPHLG